VADSFGHGTTVVGVMAARTNNGATFDTLGVAGVCGGDGAGNAGCRILALKITAGSTGFATDFSITAACIAAVNAGARALNLSFAGEAPSEVERETFLWALERGCVVVCAAGNHGAFQGDTPQYPAAYAAEGVCIQVGACDALGQRAAFSSYGPGLDVIAPGVGIWTTFMTYPSHAGASYPGYVPNSGTSLAAPFGTGTVGLLAAARHELEDTDFQQLLRRTASDVGAPGFDPQTGAGLLDAGAALAAVDPGIGIWHGVAAATQLTPLGVDTLVAAEDAGARREPMMAQRYEVDADVALPDSFVGAPLDSADGAPWAWARLGASNVGRGDFRVSSVVPGLAQASVLAGRLHLRAHVYQVLSGGDVDVPDSTFLPVAPESARIAFTVLGRVRHAPAGGPTSPPTIPVFPNPFAASVTLFGAPGASCAIFDASGRLVRRLVIRGTGAVTWDGRDGRGHAEPEGLYLARISNRTIKLLRIR
ncbi:MAG TPA: S8 family serine peptidase, partial [Candidatus Eisenbacteria bacterium]|nr:S8 family serine peptidase [Candidatus Eisenbacteria bacterium]